MLLHKASVQDLALEHEEPLKPICYKMTLTTEAKEPIFETS